MESIDKITKEINDLSLKKKIVVKCIEIAYKFISEWYKIISEYIKTKEDKEDYFLPYGVYTAHYMKGICNLIHRAIIGENTEDMKVEEPIITNGKSIEMMETLIINDINNTCHTDIKKGKHYRDFYPGYVKELGPHSIIEWYRRRLAVMNQLTRYYDFHIKRLQRELKQIQD
jgi:hypothetical protein